MQFEGLLYQNLHLLERGGERDATTIDRLSSIDVVTAWSSYPISLSCKVQSLAVPPKQQTERKVNMFEGTPGALPPPSSTFN